MSNPNESKEELLLAAVRELLVDDNSDTGVTVREIHYYCADRIQREHVNADIAYPRIDLEIEVTDTATNLPSGNFFLNVTPKVGMNQSYAQTTLDRITQRCIHLLENQENNLNLAAAVSGKNLRVRLIQKESALRVPDGVFETFSKFIRFSVIMDDDVLT
jgi:hypothetical protein